MIYKNSFTKKNKLLSLDDNPSDKVYTPNIVAMDIIKTFDAKFGISGKVLEPCAGKGAFYNNFNLIKAEVETDYCEIDEGKDFLEYQNKVDWIITNPPYSVFEDIFKHSMELADNIIYLIPINKLTSSYRRIMDIHKFGGVRYIKIYKGKDCGFPFGFALGAVYIQKNYNGTIEVEF